MKRLIALLTVLFVAVPRLVLADVDIAAGTTSRCVELKILDTTETTPTNKGKTGLSFASVGLTCSYHRDTASSSVEITPLVTSTLGTYANGAFKEVDATKQPGVYQMCPPDAALATGANSVTFTCLGAADMSQADLYVNLVQPNTFGYDGVTASETAATPAAGNSRYGLATGAIDADDQFAYQAEVLFFKTSGLLEAQSCIIDSVNTGDTVDLAEDVTGLTTVGDHYVIRPNSACRNLRPTVAGTRLDVSSGGGAGLDWANVKSPTTTVGLTGTTISVSQVIASVTGNLGGSVVGNVSGNLVGTIGGMTAGALKDFFDTNSTTNYAGAVAGSVVKEIADNAAGAGGNVTIVTGTAQSVTASPAKLRLAASSAYGDNVLRDNASIMILSSSGNAAAIGDVMCIKSNTASTDEVVFNRAWPSTPSGTVTYAILPTPNCNTSSWPVSR